MGLEVIKEVYRKKAEERERLRIKVIKDTFKVLEKLKEEVSFIFISKKVLYITVKTR